MINSVLGEDANTILSSGSKNKLTRSNKKQNKKRKLSADEKTIEKRGAQSRYVFKNERKPNLFC